MDNETILKKAIEKAIKNGLKVDKYFLQQKDLTDYPWKEYMRSKRYFVDIFSHDFAKAFFGENYVDNVDGSSREDEDKVYFGSPAYQYHLQEMVLEKEPLKYLAKFL